MITFNPYIAKKIGINEAIVYEIAVKHPDVYENAKYWAKLDRYMWLSELFFMKEYEYEQALENLVKYKVLERKGDMYANHSDRGNRWLWQDNDMQSIENKI